MRSILSLWSWWFLLATGFGGIAMFAFMVVEDGVPPLGKFRLWGWLLFSLLATAVSARRLIRDARAADTGRRGTWHLSTTDLLVAMFFSAAVMVPIQAINPKRFVPAGVVLSLCVTLILVAGMLAAGNRGIGRKWTFGFGFLLIVFGVMVSGGFMSTSILWAVVRSPAHALGLWKDLLGFGSWTAMLELYIFRIGCICLPCGLWLCRMAAAKEPQPKQEATTA